MIDSTILVFGGNGKIGIVPKPVMTGFYHLLMVKDSLPYMTYPGFAT